MRVHRSLVLTAAALAALALGALCRGPGGPCGQRPPCPAGCTDDPCCLPADRDRSEAEKPSCCARSGTRCSSADDCCAPLTCAQGVCQ